jgi:hypothetical protein
MELIRVFISPELNRRWESSAHLRIEVEPMEIGFENIQFGGVSIEELIQV